MRRRRGLTKRRPGVFTRLERLRPRMQRVQINPSIAQGMGDLHRRQEAVQRLLDAAVRVVGEIRQGVERGGGQRRVDLHQQGRASGFVLLRDRDGQLRYGLVGLQDAACGQKLLDPVGQCRERLLYGVAFFVRFRRHLHRRLPVAGDMGRPVHPLLAVRGNGDRLLPHCHALCHPVGRRVYPYLPLGRGEPCPYCQDIRVCLQADTHGFCRSEVVADNRAQGHGVALDKEAGGFQPHQQVLVRDRLRVACADKDAGGEAACSRLPGGQRVGEVNRQRRHPRGFVGHDRRCPERRFGEVAAYLNRRKCPFAAAGIVGDARLPED